MSGYAFIKLKFICIAYCAMLIECDNIRRTMDVEFEDSELDQLEIDPRFDARLPQGVVSSFRRRMMTIRGAPDERIFRESKGLHYEKLKGKRKDQRSMRLNNKYRLILRIEERDNRTIVVIISIEDYH